jgi:hypothetical protein
MAKPASTSPPGAVDKNLDGLVAHGFEDEQAADHPLGQLLVHFAAQQDRTGFHHFVHQGVAAVSRFLIFFIIAVKSNGVVWVHSLLRIRGFLRIRII